MKKLVVMLIVLCVLGTMSLVGVGCNKETAAEETAAEEVAAEETAAEEEVAAEEVAEEEISAEIKEVGDLTVAICGHGLEAESCQRDYQQAKIECEHRGWEMVDAMTVVDSAEQRATMEALIEKGVDAIVIIYWDMEAVADLCLEAEEAGIGVYCVDTELRPGCIVNATENNAVVGAMMAEYGLVRMGMKGKVAIISMKWHIARRRGYVAATLFERDYPAVELVAEEFVEMDGYTDQSVAITENWMTKYGNDLDWIFAGWDTPGQFAARVVEQEGYTKDDIFVTGIDGGSATYQLIREGGPFVASISQPFELYVHNVFEAIAQIESGIMPGDPGSIVPADSRTIYSTPVLTDDANCPEPGTSIHAVFGYYGGDPDDPDAWYNWQEAGGPYTIQ